MIVMAKHNIDVSNLKQLIEELQKLPESVLNTAIVVEASVDKVEERTFSGWSTSSWSLFLDLEWPVALV